MVRKTTKMLKKLNWEGIKFDSIKKKFSSSKRKPISKVDWYNCGELGHLAHQCTKPKKNKFKCKKDDENDDETKEKKFFKNKASKRGFTKGRMGKNTLLMIDSPILNTQATLLQVKKMMKRSPPSPWISLHHHHHLHPLHTYASWLKLNRRYKMILSLLKIVIVIVMMNMFLLLMMS
jgi:hypothetical protein